MEPGKYDSDGNGLEVHSLSQMQVPPFRFPCTHSKVYKTVRKYFSMRTMKF